jgi:predicted Zn-dependent peptidase
VLATGRASRLQRSLVLDRPLAVYLSLSNDARVDGGAFWLFAQCAQGVEPAKLEAAIEEELLKLATKPVSAAELKRAKSFLRSSHAFEHETVSDLAEDLGSYAVDAEWPRALDAVERCERVTARDVKRFASELLRRERRVTAWSLPRDAANGRAANGKRAR